ncbi:hypothetical protein FOCC_FOCC015212, partial [Frankliniella occidentalis]
MDVTQGENLDEWMTVARHLPNQNVERVELGTREMDLAHDWASEGHRYGNLDVLRTFLQTAKAEFVVERTTSTGPAVHLSPEQQVVMDILSLQIEEIVKPRGSTPPRLVIVQGKAGCGKSTVIKAVTSTLDARLGRDSYRLMAFTAVAALGINGLQLPIRPRDFAPLTGERAKAFQDDMENVRFLFIDEYSMVSLSLLGMVERRCSEAHPYSKELFGNMHIYLIGNLAQLPPVCSKAIYRVPKDGSSEMDLRGHYTFAQFKHDVVLSQSKRQTDTTLCSVLDEIGRGCCSVESYKLLQQRFSSVVPPPEQRQFRDAMHIFSTNSDARAYNIKRLVELNCPVARIPAVHNNDTAKKAGPDEAGGLESFIYLSVGALTKAGLVNGALGTVAAVVYAEGQSPPNKLPFTVLVRFQRYTGPVIKVDGFFPTLPLTRTFKVKEVACSREQVPLRLAWGSTVHSAQGLTLDRVVVNVGKREFQSGLSYVAMTRGKTWDTLLIDPPFVRARLSTLHTAPSLKRRLTAIQKIVNMAQRTKAQLGYPTEPPLPQPGPSPSEPPGPPPAPSPSPPPVSPAPLPINEDVVDFGGVMARVAVVPGNGHCLFVSLLHQLNGTMPSEQQVTNLRWRVVTHIRQRLAGPLREEWEQLLVGTLLDVSDRFPEMENGIALSLETRIDRYLNALKNSEWGAMETVRAVSEMENASITVFREAGVANVFHQGDQRHLAVVFRLRPIQEEEGANLWNHYDSFLDFESDEISTSSKTSISQEPKKKRRKKSESKEPETKDNTDEDDSSDDEEIKKINQAASKIPTYKSIKNLTVNHYYKVLDLLEVETSKGKTIRLKLEDADVEDKWCYVHMPRSVLVDMVPTYSTLLSREKAAVRQRKKRMSDTPKTKALNRQKASEKMAKIRKRKSKSKVAFEKRLNAQRRMPKVKKKSAQQRNKADANRKAEQRRHESFEVADARRLKDAARQKHRRSEEDPETAAARRQANASRQSRRRDEEDPKDTATRRQNALLQKRSREEEDLKTAAARRQEDAARHKRGRDEEGLEAAAARRKEDAARHKRGRDEEDAKAEARRREDAARHASQRLLESLNVSDVDQYNFTCYLKSLDWVE